MIVFYMQENIQRFNMLGSVLLEFFLGVAGFLDLGFWKYWASNIGRDCDGDGFGRMSSLFMLLQI